MTEKSLVTYEQIVALVDLGIKNENYIPAINLLKGCLKQAIEYADQQRKDAEYYKEIALKSC